MDKTDYFDKMDALVNDKQTYEELKRDPTPALQRKLNSKILMPGLQVSLYFPYFLYFLTSPIFSYLIQKLPIIPIMVELKGKKSIFVESCKIDSAQLAFLLSMEPIFKKFLCFFQSEGSLVNLLCYENNVQAAEIADESLLEEPNSKRD